MSTTATTYETSEQYRKMSIQIRELQEELAKQKEDNAVLAYARSQHYTYRSLYHAGLDHAAELDAENAQLKANRKAAEKLIETQREELHGYRKGYERLKEDKAFNTYVAEGGHPWGWDHVAYVEGRKQD